MRLAVFIGKSGVERVVPAAGAGFEDTENAMKFYRVVREEIEQFDAAIRRRTAQSEKSRAHSAVSA